jgi:ferredoxin
VFYVDSQCIDCDLCREIAPSFFKQNSKEGHSYVYNQPTSDDDIEKCNEALDSCPVDAIGNDSK